MPATPAHSPTGTPCAADAAAAAETVWNSAPPVNFRAEPAPSAAEPSPQVQQQPEPSQEEDLGPASEQADAGEQGGECADVLESEPAEAPRVGLLVDGWEARAAAVPPETTQLPHPGRPWSRDAGSSQDSDAATSPGDPLSPGTQSESAASSRPWSAASSVDDDWSGSGSGGGSSTRAVHRTKPSRSERRRLMEERMARAESEVKASRRNATEGGRAPVLVPSVDDAEYSQRLQRLRGSRDSRQSASAFTALAPEPEEERPQQQAWQPVEEEEEQEEEEDEEEQPQASHLGGAAPPPITRDAPAAAAPAPAASPAARHSAAGVSRSSSTPHKEPSRWAPGVRGRDDDGAGYSRTPQWVAAAAAASTAGNRGPVLSEADRSLAKMEHGLDCLAGWSPMAVSSSPSKSALDIFHSC